MNEGMKIYARLGAHLAKPQTHLVISQEITSECP